MKMRRRGCKVLSVGCMLIAAAVALPRVPDLAEAVGIPHVRGSSLEWTLLTVSGWPFPGGSSLAVAGVVMWCLGMVVLRLPARHLRDWGSVTFLGGCVVIAVAVGLLLLIVPLDVYLGDGLSPGIRDSHVLKVAEDVSCLTVCLGGPLLVMVGLLWYAVVSAWTRRSRAENEEVSS
jgi:hypothetical protein